MLVRDLALISYATVMLTDGLLGNPEDAARRIPIPE
jgi:hypothetical protein